MSADQASKDSEYSRQEPSSSRFRGPAARPALVLFGLMILVSTAACRAQDEIDEAEIDPLPLATLNAELTGPLVEQLRPVADVADAATGFDPVFQTAGRLSVDVLQAAANKFRRARIRLTREERDGGVRPFRVGHDLRDHLNEYFGRPVTVYGSLTAGVPQAEERAEWLAEMTLSDTDVKVLLVLPREPNALASGPPEDDATDDQPESGDGPEASANGSPEASDDASRPVRVTGYAFPAPGLEPRIVLAGLVFEWIEADLPSDLLAHVVDRTVRFTQDEADAYYQVLAHVARVSERDLREAATKFIDARLNDPPKERPSYLTSADRVFFDVFKRPDVYRGKPVTMTGMLRKLISYQADELNEFGVTTLYEGWLFADESQSHPTVVVFTEKPEGIPLADELTVRATVTGYFFKKYGYTAKDATLLAPMLLARTIHKVPEAEMSMAPAMWIGIAVAGVLLIVTAAYVRTARRDKRLKGKRRDQGGDEPPNFEQLDGA